MKKSVTIKVMAVALVKVELEEELADRCSGEARILTLSQTDRGAINAAILDSDSARYALIEFGMAASHIRTKLKVDSQALVWYGDGEVAGIRVGSATGDEIER